MSFVGRSTFSGFGAGADGFVGGSSCFGSTVFADVVEAGVDTLFGSGDDDAPLHARTIVVRAIHREFMRAIW